MRKVIAIVSASDGRRFALLPATKRGRCNQCCFWSKTGGCLYDKQLGEEHDISCLMDDGRIWKPIGVPVHDEQPEEAKEPV